MDTAPESQPRRLAWSSISITHKLATLIGLMVASLGLLIFLALRQATNVTETAYQQDKIYYNINSILTGLTSADNALQDYLRSAADAEEASAAWNEQCRQLRILLDWLPNDADEIGLECYFLTRALQNGFAAYTEQGEALLAMRSAGADSPAMYDSYDVVAATEGYLSQTTMELQTLTLNNGQENLATLRANNRQRNVWYGLLLTAIILILVWLIREVLHSLVRPILHLADASRTISEGNFDQPDLAVENRDEIYTLVQAFNHMKHSMKRSFEAIREKTEMEQRLHQSELAASESRRLLEQAKMQQLRSQINPHFLFNSLNIISRTAQREQAPDTKRLILALARLFRYGLKTDDTEVALQREMKIVDDYISIQHTRFADRVRLRWRVAPDLAPDTLAVPAFLLQPIVENAVIHGLEPKVEGGLIRIRIHMRENALHIIISDNGVGMPREILDTLLQQQSAKGDVSGIGMGNVRTRLQMLYPQARFTLHSAIGRGTCVHIVIPDPHRIEGANEWAAAQQKGGAPA